MPSPGWGGGGQPCNQALQEASPSAGEQGAPPRRPPPQPEGQLTPVPGGPDEGLLAPGRRDLRVRWSDTCSLGHQSSELQ